MDLPAVIASVLLTVVLTLPCLYVLYRVWILPTIREYTDAVPEKIEKWIGTFKEQLLSDLMEAVTGKLGDVKKEIYGAVGGHSKKAKTLLNKALIGELSPDEVDALTNNPMIDRIRDMFQKVSKKPEKPDENPTGGWELR